jgi:hypothetical protein
MKPLSVLLAIASLALVAAGCGGDDNSNTDTTRGYTATRGYAETGQAISDVCTQAKGAVEKLSNELNGKAKHDAPVLAKLVPINSGYVKKLAAIKPDPKLQESFDAYVAAVQASDAKAKAALAAAQSGDQAAYEKSLKDLQAADKVTDPIAKALGAAKACNN